MDLEDEYGLRSCFNFVPERYKVSDELLSDIRARGFGIGVHGLRHDGKLFRSHKVFKNRAKRINYFLEKWDTRVFSSPSMHHNLGWIHNLDVEVSLSTFDTDPFEPQADGVCTIFPIPVHANNGGKALMELPYTLPQDFTLFVLLREQGIEIWMRKMRWILENGGMVLLNTHPDYMKFGRGQLRNDEYPVDLYRGFLSNISAMEQRERWHALPQQIPHCCSVSPNDDA